MRHRPVFACVEALEGVAGGILIRSRLGDGEDGGHLTVVHIPAHGAAVFGCRGLYIYIRWQGRPAARGSPMEVAAGGRYRPVCPSARLCSSPGRPPCCRDETDRTTRAERQLAGWAGVCSYSRHCSCCLWPPRPITAGLPSHPLSRRHLELLCLVAAARAARPPPPCTACGDAHSLLTGCPATRVRVQRGCRGTAVHSYLHPSQARLLKGCHRASHPERRDRLASVGGFERRIGGIRCRGGLRNSSAVAFIAHNTRPPPELIRHVCVTIQMCMQQLEAGGGCAIGHWERLSKFMCRRFTM